MEINKEVVRLYGLKIQLKNIAKFTGLTISQVRRIIYLVEKVEKRNKAYTRSEINQVRELYFQKNMSSKQIAEIMGVKKERIYSLTKNHLR
jgi:predicted XRE-type DNA-binding protein